MESTGGSSIPSYSEYLSLAPVAKPRALPGLPVALSVLLGPRATSKLNASHASAEIPARGCYAEQRLKPRLSLRPITPNPRNRCSERDFPPRFALMRIRCYSGDPPPEISEYHQRQYGKHDEPSCGTRLPVRRRRPALALDPGLSDTPL